MREKSSILITGGTGSLGHELVKLLLKSENVERIVIFSRDEYKQFLMRQKFNFNPKLRWFLGDVRDLDRLKLAFSDIDYVIHCAALKQVDTGEYNPLEFIKTNVSGSANVIEASIESRVKKTISLSTDKASSPINLYGATKLTSDKLFISGNNYGAKKGSSFSVVRYGNVFGSRGSVIEKWREITSLDAPFQITDKRMTRFWITIHEAAKFVLESFDLMVGGEIFVPKIPSMKIIDIATAISPEKELVEIGIRPGEKLHEEMIPVHDANRTTLRGRRYTVYPAFSDWKEIEMQGVLVDNDFCYSSDRNDEWLTINEIKNIINEKHK